jgi:hypothetical protein
MKYITLLCAIALLTSCSPPKDSQNNVLQFGDSVRVNNTEIVGTINQTCGCSRLVKIFYPDDFGQVHEMEISSRLLTKIPTNSLTIPLQ